MSIDAWIREQCSAAVVGPRLRAEGWTMTDAEVEAVLLAAEPTLAREETAARLAEWGEEFARRHPVLIHEEHVVHKVLESETVPCYLAGAMQTTHSATRFHTLAMKTATKTVKLPHLPARKEAWPWSDDVVADRADAEIARLRVSKKPDPFAASNARKPREQK